MLDSKDIKTQKQITVQHYESCQGTIYKYIGSKDVCDSERKFHRKDGSSELQTVQGIAQVKDSRDREQHFVEAETLK